MAPAGEVGPGVLWVQDYSPIASWRGPSQERDLRAPGSGLFRHGLDPSSTVRQDWPMAATALRMPVSDEANTLLSSDPFALLVGMVLDQQVPLEKAFSSPLELKRRLGGPWGPAVVASCDEDRLVELFATPPALHRFPKANALRVQKLARIVIDDLDGDAARVWTDATSGKNLVERVESLPGFGARKARIFVALLGKQMNVRPHGWRKACAPFGDDGVTMSIADIVDDESLLEVRAWKKAQKAAAKAASGD